MAKDQNQESRQSKELEALLLKLNGGHKKTEKIEQNESFPSIADLEEDIIFDDENDEDLSLSSLTSLDSAQSIDTSFTSAEESFFIQDEDEEEDAHDSGPVPLGSGAYARIPSGGFHIIVDKVREKADKAVIFFKEHAATLKTKITPNAKEKTTIRRNQKGISKEQRNKRILLAAAVLGLLVCIIVIANSTGKHDDANDFVAASQAPAFVPENDNIDTLNSKNSQNSDQEITQILPQQNTEELAQDNVDWDALEVQKESQPVAQAQALQPQLPPANVELRLFGSKDNLLENPTTGEAMKLKRVCVMREGPASRFGLVKSLPVGSKVEILAKSDEDWELKETNGKYTWHKNGESQPRLGPGKHFKIAWDGQHVPKPTSRVISSPTWRYIKANNLYGWVGPACFK